MRSILMLLLIASPVFAQARAAGLGFVANHFEGIDTRRAGRVSFEDVRRYWAARSAAAKSDHAQ